MGIHVLQLVSISKEVIYQYPENVTSSLKNTLSAAFDISIKKCQEVNQEYIKKIQKKSSDGKIQTFKLYAKICQQEVMIVVLQEKPFLLDDDIWRIASEVYEQVCSLDDMRDKQQVERIKEDLGIVIEQKQLQGERDLDNIHKSAMRNNQEFGLEIQKSEKSSQNYDTINMERNSRLIKGIAVDDERNSIQYIDMRAEREKITFLINQMDEMNSQKVTDRRSKIKVEIEGGVDWKQEFLSDQSEHSEEEITKEPKSRLRIFVFGLICLILIFVGIIMSKSENIQL